MIILKEILKSNFENEKCESLKKNDNRNGRKVVVFMSCCDSVDFHFDLFNGSKEINENNYDYVDDNDDDDDDDDIGKSSSSILKTIIFQLHGNISQEIRIKTFNKFCREKSGILFCTDVAARGLDLPDVT